MSYKIVCVHEFYDDIGGTQINRGDEIYDYNTIARLIAAGREHHFNKVWLVMSAGQWDWPPRLPVETPVATPAPAAAMTTPEEKAE
jgi:hypothetical protein